MPASPGKSLTAMILDAKLRIKSRALSEGLPYAPSFKAERINVSETEKEEKEEKEVEVSSIGTPFKFTLSKRKLKRNSIECPIFFLR